MEKIYECLKHNEVLQLADVTNLISNFQADQTFEYPNKKVFVWNESSEWANLRNIKCSREATFEELPDRMSLNLISKTKDGKPIIQHDFVLNKNAENCWDGALTTTEGSKITITNFDISDDGLIGKIQTKCLYSDKDEKREK